MWYRWNDFVSNQRLLRETESRPITSIVRQCQLWLYGHVVRYQEADPASRVVSEKDNSRAPTKFIAEACLCFLLGVIWCGKGACMDDPRAGV